MHSHILILGGTGKTGSRLAVACAQRNLEFRVASRSATGAQYVRFDWRDLGTFPAALKNCRAVYLVAPTDTTEHLDVMRPFLELAQQQGVEQFVLLSASSIEAGGPMMGAVHEYLRDRVPRWTVLRPSWFMQNFSEGPHHTTIREEGRVYSATDDGRVPFIDAADIASVAVEALSRPDFANGEHILSGGRALSYDDVASILSKVVGKSVVHHRLTEAELTAHYLRGGLPESYAPILAAMDTEIATGSEDRVSGAVIEITGKAPRTFEAFAAQASKAWRPAESLSTLWAQE